MDLFLKYITLHTLQSDPLNSTPSISSFSLNSWGQFESIINHTNVKSTLE